MLQGAGAKGVKAAVHGEVGVCASGRRRRRMRVRDYDLSEIGG